MSQLDKNYLDVRVYSFDFSAVSEIQEGATISTVSTTVSPDTLTLSSPSISGSGKIVYMQISGGTATQTYVLTISANLSSGSVFAEDVPIVVFA